MKIGVIGGTFDPIHNAHLAMAEEARVRLGLAQVLFIPAGNPWLKAQRNISAVEHRVAMVRLAIAPKPYFQLSTIEVERPGPTYTVDTLTELRAQIGAEDELFLILGWDSLAELPQWHEPSRVLLLCCIVAVPRPGYPPPDFESLDSLLPGLSRRVIVLGQPELDISASEIRERVARGLAIGHLVPEPVARYIREHRLYLRGG